MYKQHPGYDEKATSLFNLELGPPEDLPDALRGEAWNFVQLPLSSLLEEAQLLGAVSQVSYEFPYLIATLTAVGNKWDHVDLPALSGGCSDRQSLDRLKPVTVVKRHQRSNYVAAV